ncbi:hypothetical protein C4565_08605 [Candidatus Parcubacteria bacterium]|jgi:hypothetical protein|nr:MAG: hypothetical protein C4565_08605 [Candidatus Parcubacteria bacterium]
MKKALLIVLLVIIGLTVYFNIGTYYYETQYNVVIGNEYPSYADEFLVIGEGWWLIEGNIEKNNGGKNIQEIEIAIILLWPIITIISLGTWLVWLIFGGGLLDLVGIEFLVPITIIFFGALTYYLIHRKKK